MLISHARGNLVGVGKNRPLFLRAMTSDRGNFSAFITMRKHNPTVYAILKITRAGKTLPKIKKAKTYEGGSQNG